MRNIWISALALASLLTAIPARGDDMMTQVGSVDCKPNGNSWTCPSVAFPQPFGGTPTVVVSIQAFNIPYSPHEGNNVSIAALANNITATGFQPGAWSQVPSFFAGCTVSYVAVGPALQNAVAVPKYLVLTVVYAPPGTKGGSSRSLVSYSAGSTVGTTTSASQSFKVDNSVSFSVSGTLGGAGASFDYSHSTTNNQSITITQSANATISEPGPAVDGISNDEDEVWVLLNPTINFKVSLSSAEWALANTGGAVQALKVGWLNGHETMPPGVAQQLTAAGVTSQDYPTILARDPFATGASTFDPHRFLLLNTSFPYEPPLLPNDPVTTLNFTISSSDVGSVGSQTQDSYQVGLTVTAGSKQLGPSLTDTLTWQWTNTSSLSVSAGTNQSASVTVAGPSYGYTGPTVMNVYLDTMYQTFVFAFAPTTGLESAITGTMTGSNGRAFSSTEVTLIENGVKHRTFTNATGKFVFYGKIYGPVTIQAAGITKQVGQLQKSRKVDIRKP
jgi:hypothetical protein